MKDNASGPLVSKNSCFITTGHISMFDIDRRLGEIGNSIKAEQGSMWLSENNSRTVFTWVHANMKGGFDKFGGSRRIF